MPNYKIKDKKTIFLNTEMNCNKLQSADTLRNLEFSWDIPSTIKIDDLAHLRVALFAVQKTSTVDSVITLRIKNIDYNTRQYWSSGYNSSPIIFSGLINSTTSYWNGGNIQITLIPQMIQNITITVSDDLSNSNAGVLTDVEFMLALEIDEFDVSYTEIGNPYGEHRTQNLQNRIY